MAADFSGAKGAETVTRAFPDVDVLVNEDWLRFFETNVMSGVRLSRFYFPKMRAKAKTQGVDTKTAERDFFVNARPTSIIKRFATSEEVANLIVYVCGTKSSATNGAALRVDGGVVRAIL